MKMGRKPKLESSENVSNFGRVDLIETTGPGFLAKFGETTGHVVKLNGYYHIKPLEKYLSLSLNTTS